MVSYREWSTWKNIPAPVCPSAGIINDDIKGRQTYRQVMDWLRSCTTGRWHWEFNPFGKKNNIFFEIEDDLTMFNLSWSDQYFGHNDK